MRFKSLSKRGMLFAIACSVSTGVTSVRAEIATDSASSTTPGDEPASTISKTVLSDEQKKNIFKDFLDKSFKGKAKEAHILMDERMQAALTEEKMEFVVKQLQIMFGEFKSVENITVQKGRTAGSDNLKALCVFANKRGDANAIINAEGKLCGLFVKPHVDFANPSYAKHDQFEEQELEFPSGKLQIKATLAVPLAGAPHACVVLVHGSGPCDRDETVGNIKVFRDLAWGLASNGIAVLRYEKRTRQYPFEAIKTVDDETVDDAVAAVDFLKTKSAIDPKRVFVLGHSLGALMAPKIAQKEKDLAGVIICAGPTRKLEDIVVEQITYIESLNTESSNADKVAKVKEEAAAVKLLNRNETPMDSRNLLGASPSWWIAMQDYAPIKTAQSLTMPVLVMQGERDYQVTLADLKGWQDGLKDQHGVTFKIYPGLGHTFSPASEKPSPSDYDKALNVDEGVIKDLCDWIGTQK